MCAGSCDCPSPCADCKVRRVPWLGLSVPQHALSQMAEEWLTARVEQHPRRVRFPGALPFRLPVHPADTSPTITEAEPYRAGPQAPGREGHPESTGPVSGSPARREGGR